MTDLLFIVTGSQ